MHKGAGFTLMELMTVIAIMAILASIAVPGYISWRNNAQLRRAALDVYSNFQKAKIEAARRNATCAITFTGNGFTTYVDSDGDVNLDGGEFVINTTNWSQYPGVRLDSTEGGGDGLSFANPANGIAFTPNGLTLDNSVPPILSGGTVFLANRGSKKARIVVSPAGNVRIN